MAGVEILCILVRIGASSLATFHPTLNNETVKQNCNSSVGIAVMFNTGTKPLEILTEKFDTSHL
jgi:hypothetical protein